MSQPESHHSERVEERNQAIEAIERTLSGIEGQGREPDLWERALLVQAISWLFRAGYRIATVDAELALTPPRERSRLSLQPDPLLDRCQMSVLRAAFREAAAEPIRDFPAFGPIVFTRGAS